jgi:DNA-binding MarR family transcriptional regulator
MSLVIKSLRERGLVNARSDASDRRKTLLELSDPGRLVLAQAEQRSAKSGRALLSMFDRKQAEALLSMLRRLDDATSGPEG